MHFLRRLSTAAQNLPVANVRDQTVVPLAQRVFPLWRHQLGGSDRELFAEISTPKKRRPLHQKTKQELNSLQSSRLNSVNLITPDLVAILNTSKGMVSKASRRKAPTARSQTELDSLLDPLVAALMATKVNNEQTALVDSIYSTLFEAFVTTGNGLKFHPRLFSSRLKHLMTICADSLGRIDLAEYLLMNYIQSTQSSSADMQLYKIDPQFVQLSPFVRMIEIYCAAGRLEDGIKVLQHVKNSKLKPTTHAFTPLIQSCASKSDLPLATKALESLLNSKQRAAPALYNHILKLCFSHEDQETLSDLPDLTSIAPKTLTHLFKFSTPTSLTFQLLLDQCDSRTGLYNILTDLESRWSDYLSSENVQKSIIWAFLRTEPPTDDQDASNSFALSGCLDLARRITLDGKRVLTPGASILLARLYLRRSDWGGALRVLKDPIARQVSGNGFLNAGDVRQVNTFFGTEFLKALIRSQRQGVEGLDTTCVWNMLDSWTQCVLAVAVIPDKPKTGTVEDGAADIDAASIKVRDACKVVELLGLMGDFVTLKLLYNGFRCGSLESLPSKLTIHQWGCLTRRFRQNDVRVAVSFLRSAVSLRNPDLELAQRVISDFICACGEENKQVGVAELLEALLLQDPHKIKNEEDSRIRKMAAGIVVDFVKRDKMTDGAAVADLRGLLSQKSK
ncbi:hypothetical protein BDR26DRAFT_855745, partial [Obelidium mucronatum]